MDSDAGIRWRTAHHRIRDVAWTSGMVGNAHPTDGSKEFLENLE
jgi:hypothetical protein